MHCRGKARKHNYRVRRPNFLKAKWGHVPNFRVRSGDKCITQILRYLCIKTAPYSISRLITDQRPSRTLMVLGAYKNRHDCNVLPNFPSKSPPLGYVAKVVYSSLVQRSNSSYQSSLDNPSERLPDY